MSNYDFKNNILSPLLCTAGPIPAAPLCSSAQAVPAAVGAIEGSERVASLATPASVVGMPWPDVFRPGCGTTSSEFSGKRRTG
jgi:hypothetical protein